ncbi:MAG: lipopolysaccharide heptosyltransferase family protein [Planctomycetota bacterium]|nr:MAG: lipopolysaccharide heptosyltransferase family protein [Planctomycetota bacterium]
MSAQPTTSHPKRILLVRNDRIGDLVLTLPAMEAVRRHWPDAHLTALVSPYAGPLLLGQDAVDDVMYDEPALKAGQLARRLRPLQFDAALVFNTNTRNCLAVWRARIRQRVCWAYKPVGWLTATHRVALRRSHPPVHESDFALAFVRALGCPVEPRPALPAFKIDPAARKCALERITRLLGTGGPLFGVHPGNRNSAYNWPAERYSALVAQLSRHGRVLVTGGPGEHALLETIRRTAATAYPERVAYLCDLSLLELAATIAAQTVLVVSSTGPMHLAGLVGTPTVALFSPHPAHVPAKWAPLGDNHTILVAPLADGEDPEVPRERGTELMSRIALDEVLHAALDHWQRSQAPAA